MRKRNTVVTVMVFLLLLSIAARFCFWIDEFRWPKKYTHICPPPSTAETLLSLSVVLFPFFRSLLTNTFYEYKFSMSIRSIMSLLSNYFLSFFSSPYPFALVLLHVVFVVVSFLCSCTHFQLRILMNSNIFLLHSARFYHSTLILSLKENLISVSRCA